MGRFAAAPDQMQGITVWLRQGGSDFVQKMDASISVAHDFYRHMRANDAQREDEITKIKDPEMQAVRARAHLSGQQSRGNLMAGTRNKMEETILRRCVSGDNATPSISVLSLNQLRAKCPGIAASVAVGVHAARRASEEVTPRPLEASDFGDAMHAIYAPYVDIYRADGFMADAVTKALKGRGTSVARRLADVPALIREHLNNDTGL